MGFFLEEEPAFDLSDGAGEPRFDAHGVCTLCKYYRNRVRFNAEIATCLVFESCKYENTSSLECYRNPKRFIREFSFDYKKMLVTRIDHMTCCSNTSSTSLDTSHHQTTRSSSIYQQFIATLTSQLSLRYQMSCLGLVLLTPSLVKAVRCLSSALRAQTLHELSKRPCS